MARFRFLMGGEESSPTSGTVVVVDGDGSDGLGFSAAWLCNACNRGLRRGIVNIDVPIMDVTGLPVNPGAARIGATLRMILVTSIP